MKAHPCLWMHVTCMCITLQSWSCNIESYGHEFSKAHHTHELNHHWDCLCSLHSLHDFEWREVSLTTHQQQQVLQEKQEVTLVQGRKTVNHGWSVLYHPLHVHVMAWVQEIHLLLQIHAFLPDVYDCTSNLRWNILSNDHKLQVAHPRNQHTQYWQMMRLENRSLQHNRIQHPVVDKWK